MNLLFNNFFYFDYILLVITLLFVFFSIWKGFIQSILGLMTWIGSIIITLIFYDKLSNYISYRINQINFFETLGISEFLSIMFSIPIIFIISLILLKKIKKMISSDVDKATLGIFLDKLFGIIYGFAFTYFIFSFSLFLMEQVSYDFVLIMMNNSFILENIQTFNEIYIYKHIPFFNEYTINLD